MGGFNTLADALDARASGRGEIGFIDGADDERRQSFRLLARAAMRDLAVLQDRGAARGDHVILFIADNLRFLQFFWAAIYGGLVPVPVAAGTTEAHLDKLYRVWRHLGEPRVVASRKPYERAQIWLQDRDAAGAARLAARVVADEPPAVEATAVRAECAGHDTALLQFSSGATGDPKGVILSHANLLANIDAITRVSRFAANEIALSWMPLSHDMGLIGFHLTLVYNGFDHYLMATDAFARRPLLWLRKAAEKQATLLCSPNFGYRHTLRAIGAKGLPALDLSAVRRIYNGAEPISPALAREFTAALAPAGLAANSMFAVYGLAEASLAATFGRPGAGLRTLEVARGTLGVGDTVGFAPSAGALELVMLGAPVAGTELRIAGAKGQPLAQDTVGHVWIRGASVTAGYYANRAANDKARVGDGWLDTGDLGFMHAGELVVTGRAKEIIFVNGENHYPQDIEAAAHDLPGVDFNKVAAAGVRPPGADADALVLFLVFRGAIEDFAPMAREIAAQVNRRTGLAVARVVPVERLPKTSSGKIQRTGLARAYADGAYTHIVARLDELTADAGGDARRDAVDIATDLKTICDAIAPDKDIGAGDDLFEIGLSSLELAQIHEAIEARWPDRLEVSDMFDYPTIDDLAAFLDAYKAA